MSTATHIIQADARHLPLADASVQTCITSPPYWGLRDYGHGAQLGLEPTPDDYVRNMVEVFREVRRVLRDDGTLWLNLGDSYAGSWGAQSRGDFYPGTLEGASSREVSLSARQIKAHPKGTLTGSLKRTPGLKPKDLCLIPHRVAMALQADGWWLRDTIVWHKPNPMPSSVGDRTTTAHEYVFLLTKSPRYFYDADAIREPVTSTGGACVGKQRHDAEGTGAQSRRFADPSERNNPDQDGPHARALVVDEGRRPGGLPTGEAPLQRGEEPEPEDPAVRWAGRKVGSPNGVRACCLGVAKVHRRQRAARRLLHDLPQRDEHRKFRAYPTGMPNR